MSTQFLEQNGSSLPRRRCRRTNYGSRWKKRSHFPHGLLFQDTKIWALEDIGISFPLFFGLQMVQCIAYYFLQAMNGSDWFQLHCQLFLRLFTMPCYMHPYTFRRLAILIMRYSNLPIL